MKSMLLQRFTEVARSVYQYIVEKSPRVSFGEFYGVFRNHRGSVNNLTPFQT